MTERKTLVLGASPNPERFSYRAVKKLIEHNYPLVAVGLRAGQISGVPVLKLFPDVQDIDTITVYVGPKNQHVYYDYILTINPRCVIFNPGTENPEFEKVLQNNGIQVIRGCTLNMLEKGTY